MIAGSLSAYPHQAVNDVLSVPITSTCKTDLVIEGYGSVPVLNGDPKWLPSRVKVGSSLLVLVSCF